MTEQGPEQPAQTGAALRRSLDWRPPRVSQPLCFCGSLNVSFPALPKLEPPTTLWKVASVPPLPVPLLQTITSMGDRPTTDPRYITTSNCPMGGLCSDDHKAVVLLPCSLLLPMLHPFAVRILWETAKDRVDDIHCSTLVPLGWPSKLFGQA